MILEANKRGGAKDLALHLLKEENDHVEVHELRGFVSDNLVSALNEAYAVSRGTKAKQFLFSMSLNPPPNKNVSTEDFEDAIRTAISIGGDSDTIASMTGAIAEVFYKDIPQELIDKMNEYLPDSFKKIIEDFYKKQE